jgi:hypothetical protein
MDMELVAPQFVDGIWHHLQPHLAKACKRSQNTYKPSQMWEDCRTGRRNLVLFSEQGQFRIAAICTFGDLGDQWTCNVNLLCGASVAAWANELPQFAAWCRSHGATQITYTGKRAQEKLIPGSKLVSCLYKLEI